MGMAWRAAGVPVPRDGPSRHANLIGFSTAIEQRRGADSGPPSPAGRYRSYDPLRHSLAVFRATR
jgi:hypothetical protein